MRKIFIIISYFMGGVLVAIGISLLIFQPVAASIHSQYPSEWYAAICIPYGLFRIWRAWAASHPQSTKYGWKINWLRLKSHHHNDEEEEEQEIELKK